MALRIRTLGAFEVQRDGSPITDREWKTQKNKHLCKLLLTHEGHSLAKDQLMEWLWADLDPDAAGRNMRVAISQLRKVLEPDLKRGTKSSHVLTTDGGYAWNTRPDDWFDAAEFEQLCIQVNVDDANHFDEAATGMAEQAKSLYRGPYLEEDRYEDWATARREALQLKYFALLIKLSEGHARLGRYQQAITLCREVLQSDPCREQVWSQLMLYLYCTGNQPEALRAYDQCVQILQKELDVEPGKRLQQLQHQIRNRHVPEIETLYPVSASATQDIPYTLSSIPFVGRQAEQKKLQHFLSVPQRDHASCMLVAGEPGVGKTRLVQEALTKQKASVCLSAYCHTSEMNLSYRTWADVVRQAVASLDADTLNAIEPLWLAEAVGIVPELRQQLNLPQNPALAPDQQQLRFHQAILRILSEAAAQKPLIIFFDDVHWMDAQSLALWQFLLARLDATAIRFIGTYRKGEESAHLLQFLKASDHKIESLSLSTMNAQEGITLLKTLPLKLDDVEGFCSKLYQDTEGNPLFMLSTLQHLFESHVLASSEQGWVSTNGNPLASMNLPPTIQALIQQRLEKLNAPALKLLRLVSVLGREVDAKLLDLLWEDEVDYPIALADLTSAQLLSEHLGQYKVSHGNIREVVVAQLSAPMSQLLHQRVLYALEQRYVGQVDAWLGTLAQHAFRAGVWEKALTYAVRVLNKEDRTRLQEKLTLAELGETAAHKLELSGKDTDFVKEQLFDLMLKRAEIFGLQGNREGQRNDLEQLERLATSLDYPGKQAQVLVHWLTFHLAKGEFAQAVEAAQQAIHLYEADQDIAGQAHCLNHMGQALHQQGDPQAALAVMEQALDLFQQAKQLKGQADCLKNIGQVHFSSLAKYEKALDFFEQANAHYATLGDLPGQAGCINSIGNVCYWCLGRTEEAIQHYEQALEFARDIGDRFGVGLLLNNIGNVYRTLSLGKLHVALDYLQQAHDIGEEVSDPVGQSMSLGNIGKIYFSIGQYDKALVYHHRALHINRDIGERGEEAGNLYELGKTHLELEDFEQALEALQQSLAIGQETGDQRSGAYVPVEMARVYAAQGQFDLAIDHLQQAQQVLDELDIAEEQVNVWINRTLTRLRMGEAERALRDSENAVQYIESERDKDGLPEVFFYHYRVLSALGRNEEAETFLQQAYETVMEISELIQEKDHKESFLTNVQLNRQIVSAWTQHTRTSTA